MASDAAALGALLGSCGVTRGGSSPSGRIPERELREDVRQDIALILCQRVPHALVPVEAPYHVHWTRAVPRAVRIGRSDPVAGLAVGRVEAGGSNPAGRQWGGGSWAERRRRGAR